MSSVLFPRLNNEIETVAATCHDWADRDETAAIFTNPDGEQDSSRLFQSVSMKDLGIDYIIVYNASGNRVFSETISRNGNTVEDAPLELDTIVHDSILPEGFSGGVSGRRGSPPSITIPSSLSVILSCTVTRLIPRRGLSSWPVSSILKGSATLIRCFSWTPRSSPTTQKLLMEYLSADEWTKAKGGAIIIRQADENHLDGFAIITGIENEPSFFLLKIETNRPVYQEVQRSILIVATAIIFLSIAFLVAIQLLLQGFVLAPLNELDNGMKSIGRSGDLTLRIPEKGDEEIVSLTHSLNQMLGQIQQQQDELHDLLEEIEQQRDDLRDAREALAERNRDLEELNRKANLYLDIYLDAITYEILNAIMGLRGYAELFRHTAQDSERIFADKIIALAKKSDDVIRNIETISRIYKNPSEIKAVDLASIIKKEMQSRPGIRLIMENCNRTVLANDMLGVVFDNLFSNSLKFGGMDTEITVTAREVPEGLLEISVSDTGPGIPDAMKTLVFDRFMQDSRKRSSYGLGLHIVKMLIEGYGGKVWADDRIPGDQQSGTAIRFTLRLA